jgi:hypothetical protein
MPPPNFSHEGIYNAVKSTKEHKDSWQRESEDTKGKSAKECTVSVFIYTYPGFAPYCLPVHSRQSGSTAA